MSTSFLGVDTRAQARLLKRMCTNMKLSAQLKWNRETVSGILCKVHEEIRLTNASMAPTACTQGNSGR